MIRLGFIAFLTTATAATAPVPPVGWAAFGGGPSRNMASPTARGLPDSFDPATGAGVRWTADLGTRSYTQPVVAGGRVFVGTNNERPRNPRDTKAVQGEQEPIDKYVLMCFDAGTGKFLWQAVHDRPPNPPVGYWPKEGLLSTPAVDGERVYYLTPDAKVVCADVAGFADGNQGLQNEKYADATDADLLWVRDLRKDYGVEPHCMAASSSPLVIGDAVFLVTGNGVDDGHREVANPAAPSFVALDKRTGKVLWTDASPGKDVLHGQWSSPAFATEPVPQVIFPGGDGWLRAFDPASSKLLWKFDANPKGAKHELGGTGDRNDLLATPVIHDGRLYIGTGQDPEHFSGPANFWCLDLGRAVRSGAAAADRDVSPDRQGTALVWRFGGPDARRFAPRNFVFGRTLSTACVVDDRVYIAELQGWVHCLDRLTGALWWSFDTKGAIWASPYFADGKVYVATESGELFVFRHAANPKRIDPLGVPNAANQKEFNAGMTARLRDVSKEYLLAKIEFDAPIRGTPSAVGDTLFVATERMLYAIGRK